MTFWENFSFFIMENFEKSLILGIVAAFFGLLAIILDYGNYYLFKKSSFLKLEYSRSLFWVSLFYVICSGVIGFLGVITNILNYTIQTALLVGFGWPAILTRIFKSLEADEDEQIDDREEE